MTAEGPEQATMDQDGLRRLALAAAQQEAMAGPMRQLPHGSRLFTVPAGWQSRVIAAEAPNPCTTLMALDKAMRDESTAVIFIPFDAMMTDDDIERVCQRHGVVKTLFREERAV